MTRVSKEEHIERMGARAARRAKDAIGLSSSPYGAASLEAVREARRKNGVGRPPRKA
jgi:hypothetical protein